MAIDCPNLSELRRVIYNIVRKHVTAWISIKLKKLLAVDSNPCQIDYYM